MKDRLVSPRFRFLVLLSVAILAGCAANPAAPSADLLNKIETAHSRADHELLSSYYAKEASVARDTVDLHRKMQKRYINWQTAVQDRIAAGMVTHCDSLIQTYEKAAVEFDAMSATHQELARQATD